MQNKLELLAPCGKWAALEAVVEAGADAVYLGGKRFNMRLLRPDFNFSDHELKEAVQYCHQRGVKLYVTVNNLYYEQELPDLADYLLFLAGLGVDAFIVQDLSVVRLIRNLKLDVPLHASVQMGVNNARSAGLLRKEGFTRAILSKNLSLKEIKQIREKTGIEVEYFVHGDLCLSHTGQCYMSTFIGGESGNRGRCRKPCRFRYRLKENDKETDYRYYLAQKDLCLYPYIGELIASGVSSFKIEGRMRDPEYLSFLVSCYRQAIDRWQQGKKLDLDEDPNWERLLANRIRDFTEGSIFGTLRADSVDWSGEREPFFPTSPLKVKTLSKEETKGENPGVHKTALVVKARDQEASYKAIRAGADGIILSCLAFRDGLKTRNSWEDTVIFLSELASSGKQAFFELPRIITAKEEILLQKIEETFGSQQIKKEVKMIAHDPGSLAYLAARGFNTVAGYGLNLSNSLALEQVKNWGASLVEPSLELSRDNLTALAKNTPLPLQLVVHGPLTGIISDYCLFKRGEIDGSECAHRCGPDLALIDELGQEYRIRNDFSCRSYVYSPYDLALLTAFPELPWDVVLSVRVEADWYDDSLLEEVVGVYRQALNDLAVGIWEGDALSKRLMELFPRGLTMVPFLGRQERGLG